MNKNCLVIVREVYEDVTTTPHFPTSIEYHGFHVAFDDIYFDGLASLPDQLRNLERTRSGSTVLDGGSRFRVSAKADTHGGVDIFFHAHPIDFPGTLVLEGSFHIDGEHVGQVITGLIDLIVAGQPFKIEQD